MTDEQIKILEDIGVDYDDVMERFVDNDALYLKCLYKFLEDDNFKTMCEGIEEKDALKAFEGAHALKGVSANLGFEDLVMEVCIITEVFRAGRLDYNESNFERLKSEYEKTIKAINSL